VGWTHIASARSLAQSGAEHPAGSRVEPLVRGSKPPEAENLLAFGVQRKQQICFIPQPNSSRVKTHWICRNLRDDLWQKWGGHVHPSPPRGDAPWWRGTSAQPAVQFQYKSGNGGAVLCCAAPLYALFRAVSGVKEPLGSILYSIMWCLEYWTRPLTIPAAAVGVGL